MTASRAARRAAVLLALVASCALALAAAACDREERRFRESPPSVAPTGNVRLSVLQPGPAIMREAANNAYDENAYALTEGQRLYNWYNCVGCHANGGGGIGPPLMDDRWIYGSEPANIYQTIMQGRPNGMPSFAGRIPASQAWQIVAYVRSLSALTPSDARSSRTDHMMVYPGSQILTKPEPPKQSFTPPPSEMP